jgi:hypothetical protein
MGMTDRQEAVQYCSAYLYKADSPGEGYMYSKLGRGDEMVCTATVHACVSQVRSRIAQLGNEQLCALFANDQRNGSGVAPDIFGTDGQVCIQYWTARR